jgi:DDE superfamily endonuclease
VLGALGLEGVLAGMSIAAATTGPLLALRSSPGLRRAGADPGAAGPAGRHRGDGHGTAAPSSGAHKAGWVRSALDAAKITYRHLPSCSPDLNPIEPCWSKLKGWLRAKAARTMEALEAELGPALATITTQDAQGWFRLCGYSSPK